MSTTLPVTIFIGSLYFIDIVGDLTSDKYVSIIPKLEIKEVIIGTNVISIGSQAFADCTRLTSITIPDSVTSIGQATFWRCSNLINVTLSNTITVIAPGLFDSCGSLETINIPISVKTIYYSSFKNTSLIQINYNNKIYLHKSAFIADFESIYGNGIWGDPFTGISTSFTE